MNRRIILTPVEDGYWMAKVPSLPGCISQGATQEQALEHIQEAVELYIEAFQEMGRPIPAGDGEGVIIIEEPAHGKTAARRGSTGVHKGSKESRIRGKAAEGQSRISTKR